MEEEYKVQKLYKGNISLRSYDVVDWIERGVTVRVMLEGSSGFMLLDPSMLETPVAQSKELPSQFEGKTTYKLYDYVWNPVESDRDNQIKALIGDEWFKQIGHTFNKEYLKKLAGYIADRRKVTKVYPAPDKVFRAFELTPYSSVRIVFIAQDPYPSNCADGLAFSSGIDVLPKSLGVIYKELENDLFNGLNVELMCNYSLEHWARQGILLLNTILTVESKSGSHVGKGWENFISDVVFSLNNHPKPLCFVLWGGYAKDYRKYINEDYHTVITGGHPASELYNNGNGSFYGGKYFSKINTFMETNYKTKIQW